MNSPHEGSKFTFFLHLFYELSHYNLNETLKQPLLILDRNLGQFCPSKSEQAPGLLQLTQIIQEILIKFLVLRRHFVQIHSEGRRPNSIKN